MTPTNPTDAQMKLADVTQADRNVAADLLDELSSLLDHNGIGQVADLIRDGEYDEHDATTAFARHRQATEARAQGLVDALGEAIATLAASRHLLAKYAPEHHWMPEHDQRIAIARQELATWRRT